MDSTTIDLTELSPKKHVIRFSTTDDDAPVSTVYVSKWWTAGFDNCPNGVRLTIEPIE